MEKAINDAGGKSLSEMTLAEMNVQWEAAKKALASKEKKV
jgi:uncharacterized protein YabN with tetrapyrrole methylase and pyrophosphatase domain